MPSIAEFFLLGQQRRQQREAADQEQAVRDQQLQQLIEERSMMKQRTSRDYVENLSAIMDPNTSDEDAAQRMQKLQIQDLPNAWQARISAQERNAKRLFEELDAKEQIQALRIGGRGEVAGDIQVPLPAATFNAALAAGSATERKQMGETGANARANSRDILARQNLQVREFDAKTRRMLAESRAGLTEDQKKLIQVRTQQALHNLQSGGLDMQDIRQIMATNMVGSQGAPTAEQMARIEQAAQDAYEEAYLGGDIFDAMNAAMVRYDIGQEKPSDTAKANLETARTTPKSGRAVANLFAGKETQDPIEGLVAKMEKPPTDENGEIDVGKMLKDAGIPVTQPNAQKLVQLISQKFGAE